MIRIKIATDFSNTPGTRYICEGSHSGEEFLYEILLPRFQEAKSKNATLEINFDDCYGYATSFLEESFGGLVREVQKKGILDNITIISRDDSSLNDLIVKYVRSAENEITKK